MSEPTQDDQSKQGESGGGASQKPFPPSQKPAAATSSGSAPKPNKPKRQWPSIPWATIGYALFGVLSVAVCFWVFCQLAGDRLPRFGSQQPAGSKTRLEISNNRLRGLIEIDQPFEGQKALEDKAGQDVLKGVYERLRENSSAGESASKKSTPPAVQPTESRKKHEKKEVSQSDPPEGWQTTKPTPPDPQPSQETLTVPPPSLKPEPVIPPPTVQEESQTQQQAQVEKPRKLFVPAPARNATSSVAGGPRRRQTTELTQIHEATDCWTGERVLIGWNGRQWVRVR